MHPGSEGGVGIVDSSVTAGWARRRLLALLSLSLLGTIAIVGGQYGDLQMARTAQAAQQIVQDGNLTRLRWAAGIDLVFAASYGYLAFLYARNGPARFREWRWIGGGLVIAAGLLDEIENVLLLQNLGELASLTDSDVELVANIGWVKWRAGILGALLLVFGRSAPRLFPADIKQRMRTWRSQTQGRYLAYIGWAVAFLLPTAVRFHTGLSFWLFVGPMALVLPLLGSHLNTAVTESRTAAPGGATDLGPARLAWGLVQLLAGVLCTAVGWISSGNVLPVLFYAGLVLVATSLASLVSEVRENARGKGWRGPLLVGAGFGALLCATRVPPGTSFFLLVAFGVFAGWLGTELGSEDYQDKVAGNPPWPIGLLGVGVVATGASLLIVGGAHPAIALGIVVVLTAIVAMASSAGDGLVVVVAIALALVWTTSPKSDPPDPERTPVAEQAYFAVLGDSFVSGEGANVYLEGTNEVVRDASKSQYTNECRRASTAWPFLLAARATTSALPDDFPTRVAFLACSGAVTENISTQPREDIKGERKGPAELDLLQQQIRALGGRKPDFIILSIGGNDAGFGDIGKTCIAPGSCAEVAGQFLTSRLREDPDEHPEGAAEPISKIGDDLNAAYDRIYEAVPGVPVVAVGYPRPMDAAGRCPGTLFDYEERVFINGFLRELNTQVEAAAERHGATYLDMTDALTSRKAHLCGSSPGAAGLNFLAFNSKGGTIRDALAPTNWVHNSIHPNPRGHKLLADEAAEGLAKMAWPPPPPPERADDPTPEPPAVRPVREVLDGVTVPQCVPAERDSCDVNGNRWLLEQVKHFYASTLLPVSLLMAGLWMTLAPVIAFTRVKGLTLVSTLGHTWSAIKKAARWLWNPLQ